MHRSRLSTFVIDCKDGEIDAAARFWAHALGRPVNKASVDDEKYRELATKPEEPMVLVQQVSHESRIHLDIETDDLEAEVARLVALGAKRVEFVKRWWVMEAPTGQRFCVVNPQRGPLEGKANEWGAPAPVDVDLSNSCPKCRPEQMKEETFSGITIDRCPVCKGIYLDKGELDALLAKKLGPAVDQFAFTATSDVMDAVSGTCPRCNQEMEPVVGPEGIRVDQCMKCEGVFLEQGELATLQLARS
jgi:Zn-finger nucleic acid-binding protein